MAPARLTWVLAALFVTLTLAAIVGVNRADAKVGGHWRTLQAEQSSFPGMTEPPALATLATELVGSPVTVLCFPESPDDEWGGFVVLPEPIIYLQGSKCGALLNVLHPGPRTGAWLRTFDGQQDVGYALMSFTHEATHLIEFLGQGAAVSNDEGLTECTAFRNAWNVTRMLSLPWKVRLAVYHAVEHAHYGKSPTGAYRTVC